jgi:hypothetical protein
MKLHFLHSKFNGERVELRERVDLNGGAPGTDPTGATDH